MTEGERIVGLLGFSPSAHGKALTPRQEEYLMSLANIAATSIVRATAYAEVDAAILSGADTVDLVFVVPASLVDAATELEALMDEADRFCESEALLTVARNDVLRDFSVWYLGQFRRQIEGHPATPWEGSLDP